MQRWEPYTVKWQWANKKREKKNNNMLKKYTPLDEQNQLNFPSTCARVCCVMLIYFPLFFFLKGRIFLLTKAMHLIKNQFEKFCVLHMCLFYQTVGKTHTIGKWHSQNWQDIDIGTHTKNKLFNQFLHKIAVSFQIRFENYVND